MSARLLDKRGKDGRFPFKYRDSGHTNLAARFRLERMRLRKAEAQTKRTVTQLKAAQK